MGVVHRPDVVKKLEEVEKFLGNVVELLFGRGEADHGRKEVTGSDSFCEIPDSHSNGRTTDPEEVCQGEEVVSSEESQRVFFAG